MRKETTAFKDQVDRQLTVIDQKIERQTAIIAQAEAARDDLYNVRRALLATAKELNRPEPTSAAVAMAS